MPRIKTNEESEVRSAPSVVAGSSDGGDHPTAIVEFPVGSPTQARFGLHIELRIEGKVANALRRIAGGYDRDKAVLNNGRRVLSCTDTVRKILEEITDEIG